MILIFSSLLFILANLINCPVFILLYGRYLLKLNYEYYDDVKIITLLIMTIIFYGLAYLLENRIGKPRKRENILRIRWILGIIFTSLVIIGTVNSILRPEIESVFVPGSIAGLVYAIPAFSYYVYRLVLPKYTK